MKIYSLTRDNKCYTVDLSQPGQATLYWQALQPEHGPTWGTPQDVLEFTGERAQPRAFVAWTRMARLVKERR